MNKMSDYYRLAKESDLKKGVSLYRGGLKKVMEPAEPITVVSYTDGKLTYIGRSGVTVTQDVDINEPYYALKSKSNMRLSAVLWVKQDPDALVGNTSSPDISDENLAGQADRAATAAKIGMGRRRTRKSRRRHHRKTRRHRK